MGLYSAQRQLKSNEWFLSQRSVKIYGTTYNKYIQSITLQILRCKQDFRWRYLIRQTNNSCLAANRIVSGSQKPGILNATKNLLENFVFLWHETFMTIDKVQITLENIFGSTAIVGFSAWCCYCRSNCGHIGSNNLWTTNNGDHCIAQFFLELKLDTSLELVRWSCNQTK